QGPWKDRGVDRRDRFRAGGIRFDRLCQSHSAKTEKHQLSVSSNTTIRVLPGSRRAVMCLAFQRHRARTSARLPSERRAPALRGTGAFAIAQSWSSALRTAGAGAAGPAKLNTCLPRRLLSTPVRSRAEEKRRPGVGRVTLAPQSVVVGHQPESIPIDRQTLHDSHKRIETMISVLGGELDRAKIELGQHAVKTRIDPQDDMVFAHQDIKIAVKPAEVRVVGSPERGDAGADFK